MLRNRISAFVNLPIKSLDKLTFGICALYAVAQTAGAVAGALLAHGMFNHRRCSAHNTSRQGPRLRAR